MVWRSSRRSMPAGTNGPTKSVPWPGVSWPRSPARLRLRRSWDSPKLASNQAQRARRLVELVGRRPVAPLGLGALESFLRVVDQNLGTAAAQGDQARGPHADR